MIDLNYINKRAFKKDGTIYTLEELSYPEIKEDGKYLLDANGNRIGTMGDRNAKVLMDLILREGCWDENPRPHYEDGAPAYTLSVNNKCHWTYDISKGESPLITLRPIAVQKSIGEILWIYQEQSTDLNLLKEKHGVTWWDEWEVNHTRTIGTGTYGAIIKAHDLTNFILTEIKEDPDGRRHILDMWQYEDFKKPHGLKPCAYSVIFNVRHGRDGVDYLDMKLIQRSSDFMVAGCINQMQYLALMLMVARDCNLVPGEFTWEVANSQIYNRHIPQAIEQLRRTPILDDGKQPYLELNPEKKHFYDIEQTDFKVKNYARKLIQEKNPAQTFEKGI
jgi:thymidylate synthase